MRSRLIPAIAFSLATLTACSSSGSDASPASSDAGLTPAQAAQQVWDDSTPGLRDGMCRDYDVTDREDVIVAMILGGASEEEAEAMYSIWEREC
jgi:hypothetical protein